MIRAIRYIILFIILIFFQVLVLNNIQFSGYVNPYIYLMVILLLPIDIPAWLLLILSFAAGMAMDFFSASPGMHTSATVLTGFARPYVLRLLAPRDGYEANSLPAMQSYGLRWFATYAVLMVLIHHTALFYIEVFRFADFFRTLSRVLLSTLFSTAFMVVLEFYRKRKA